MNLTGQLRGRADHKRSCGLARPANSLYNLT
jgi:hypothetical protein